jgi:hypothetical protein
MQKKIIISINSNQNKLQWLPQTIIGPDKFCSIAIRKASTKDYTVTMSYADNPVMSSLIIPAHLYRKPVFSQNGAVVIFQTKKNKFSLYRVKDGQKLHTFKKKHLNSATLKLSPDGLHVLAVTDNKAYNAQHCLWVYAWQTGQKSNLVLPKPFDYYKLPPSAVDREELNFLCSRPVLLTAWQTISERTHVPKKLIDHRPLFFAMTADSSTLITRQGNMLSIYQKDKQKGFWSEMDSYLPEETKNQDTTIISPDGKLILMFDQAKQHELTCLYRHFAHPSGAAIGYVENFVFDNQSPFLNLAKLSVTKERHIRFSYQWDQNNKEWYDFRPYNRKWVAAREKFVLDRLNAKKQSTIMNLILAAKLQSASDIEAGEVPRSSFRQNLSHQENMLFVETSNNWQQRAYHQIPEPFSGPYWASDDSYFVIYNPDSGNYWVYDVTTKRITAGVRPLSQVFLKFVLQSRISNTPKIAGYSIK